MGSTVLAGSDCDGDLGDPVGEHSHEHRDKTMHLAVDRHGLDYGRAVGPESRAEITDAQAREAAGKEVGYL